MWMIFLSVVLLSLIQTQHVLATGCNLVSVTSPSASTLDVKWSSGAGASTYSLNLRVVNSSSVAPLMVMQKAPSTQRLVQGLSPGSVYNVTLNVFQFLTIVCTDFKITTTVPATSQITSSRALSSTSLRFEWSSVTGADSYILFVEESFHSPAKTFNRTFRSLGGQVDGLSPSTTYTCYVFSSNSAGRGARSTTRTILTLVQPPTGVSVVSTGTNTARVTWDPVINVLLYQVVVIDNGNSSSTPLVTRDTSSTRLDISNLEPCSTYTVGVASLNSFSVPGETADVTHSTSTIDPVTTVSVDYSCSSGVATVTWDSVFGATSYRATAVDSTGASVSCTSASASCRITALTCGETYSVRVVVVSDDCESASNATSLFETVPCAPARAQTSHDCSSNVVVYSWQPTNNTLFYVARAVDDTGEAAECMTADTTCYFTNARCGHYYNYTVYAVSAGCNTEVSLPQFVRTAPCEPARVNAGAGCLSDTLLTTWESAAGALSYTVEIQGNTGQIYNCTSSSNSCAVTGVGCGEHLSVWITASNDNCSTGRVLGDSGQTVPCAPVNFSASVDCSQDSVKANWTVSIGAIFYIATAEDQNGNSYSCFSMDSNCLIEGLRCGQNYTASVIGTNLECNSSASEEVNFMTAACTPTTIEAFRDCDANHALIVWQNDQRAGLYTATMEDESGAQLNCTSNTVNNCKITSLPCGRSYNVTVHYDDGNCPTASTPVTMNSVPCSPEDVRASVSCITGELAVTWNISVPAENYRASVSRGTGQYVYCNATETRCSVGGLLCGSSYTVTVSSFNGTCFSRPSTDVKVQTIPCPPTNVTAVRACAADSAPVSWRPSDGAEYYTATAESAGGHRSECTTNTTSCGLPGLRCGDVYVIDVSGADDKCTSQRSDAFSLNTEPCAPTNVSSQLMCSAASALVFWPPSANAESYAVEATSNGQTLACSSLGHNCSLSDLVCGQAYDIHVAAADGSCVSNFSAPFRQKPVPCPPLDFRTELINCSNDATASWNTSAVPLNYSVVAVPLAADIGSVMCHSGSASCRLSGLQCGRTYNVSVKAFSGSCSGPFSLPQPLQTAPCPPESLTAVMDCGADSLRASWNASLGATSYTTTVTGPGGFSETCSTPNLTCTVSGLQCASRYNVSVTSRCGCVSSPIQTALTTGPCDPVNVTSVLQCGSDTAAVSWEAAAGAVGYTVHATEAGSQHYTSCRSRTTSCQLNQLQCGKVYNLTVMAEDATCNSTGSISAMLTAPCSPSIQDSHLICGTNSSSLSWTPTADATGYVVNATATNGHTVWCSSTTASCTLTDLLCGETYATTIIARGSRCDSVPGSGANITTAPCSPAIVSKEYTCGTSTAKVRWTDPVGRLGFLAQVAGGGYHDTCQTTNTSCEFQNLPCGFDFHLTVEAQGAQCNSTPSVSESIETVPCAPQNVSATLVCSHRSALVSWVGNLNTVRYNVTLTGQDGHAHCAQTNTTSAQLPDIHCGETYGVVVTPYSNTCTGHPSALHSFNAGLCAPSNVSVSTACEDSSVSWYRVTGAGMYIAIATAEDGHNHTCSSNYSCSCNFTDLHCGQTYSVSVVTVDQGCWSERSSAVELRTGPCPPTNLTGLVSCDTNTLTLTWDKNPVFGATYTLQTERLSGALPPSTHRTSNTSRALTNLPCGQRYAFRIAAQDGSCHGSYSPPVEISTVPCEPTNFTGHVDCGTNKGNFSWSESSGAGFYTVEVTGEHGHVASCSSEDTCCAVKLDCGRAYSATLVASSESCNSSKRADINFDSAPCLPEVLAELQCDSNVMNVSWTQASGLDEYTAWAISTDGHRASCNSSSDSCSIHDLQCGKVYEVLVTSASIQCKIIAGSDYKVHSAPCQPEFTNVEQNCSSGVVTAEWNQSSSTQNYTVKATCAAGVNSICESTDSSCSFLDLSCGQLYTFTVMGHTNECRSEISSPTEKLTSPCSPTNVSAVLNCTTRNAMVSWRSSAAATGYAVEATSMDGHNSSCSEMGTSCILKNLVCGQDYFVVVKAMHNGCPGPSSVPARLTTEPCAPGNVSILYNMSTAQVMWGAARGASWYSVQAVSDQGSMVTCESTNTSCSLIGLRCSRVYNVTVMVPNLGCNSTVTSEPSPLMTEPCPPTEVEASMACEQLSATVSWRHSALALGYVAYLGDQSGVFASCVVSGAHTYCVVSGLTCGSVYSVWVKALGRQHNSSDSTVFSLTSAPCLPSEVESEADCNSDGAAAVSWNATYGAANFSLTAAVGGGLRTLCATQQNGCHVTGLTCGETYSLSFRAANKQCNLTAPTRANLTTRPCPPQRVAVDLQCGSRTAVLSWLVRPDVELYEARAVKTSGGEVRTCNSTGAACRFDALECGEMYNFTVKAQSAGCCSQASSTVVIQTEPCQPIIVYARASCQSELVQISWHQSSGVVNYFVTASGSLGYLEFYNTTQNLLTAVLPCGQDYNVTVQGQGSECDSIPSSPAFFRTTPCIPRNVTTDDQCEFNAGSVSWAPSDGAETYVAIATGLDGHTHECVTNSTSCTWNDLHCGEVYAVLVRSKEGNCTSLPSNRSVIHMEPCVPQNLAATVSCDTNVVSLSWDADNGSNLYVVSGAAGNKTVELTTNVPTANFSDFDCGQKYSFTVTAHNMLCSGNSSAPASIETRPCPLAGISTKQDCLSGIVMVTWQTSNGSDYYTATMQTETGISGMCMSESNECSVPSLTCGYNFSVSVTASNTQCNVSSTRGASLQSVPCAATGVSAVMDCANSTALVSWSASRGAAQYSVMARSSHGNISCQTSGHSCSLENLPCGQRYAVQVVAVNDNCSTVPSQPLSLNSAPCPPQNVSAEVSCLSNGMTISWDAVEEGDGFLVSAIADDGGTGGSCNTTNTVCSVSNVTCGNTYAVEVASVRGACRGEHAQGLSVPTAPCQPQGIRGNLDCVTNSAWISWDAAPGADSYTVLATGGWEHQANCTTSSNTTCEVKDLACGKLYNFSVTAKNSKCDSWPSATINLQTALCTLSSITAVPLCHNASVLVLWNLMDGDGGNTVYTVTAEASDHTHLSCNNTGTSCYLTGARCDLQYTVIVAASSDRCSSLRSPPYRISMEPCPPRNLVVNATSEDNSAQVSWSASPVAETYHVVAVGGDGHVHTCNTTSTNCTVSELHCDQQYTIFASASHANCSGEASRNSTFNTGACQPDGPSVTFHCNNQSAVLSWTPRDNAVHYSGCAQAGNGDMLCCYSTDPTCTIQALECGAVYNFSVQASDGTRNSSFSEPVQSGAAPCPPDTVAVQPLPVEDGIQVMHFSWTPITCRDNEYNLKLTGSLLGDGEAQLELSSYWTSVTYFEIPLPCGSSFSATVESRNAAGASVPSGPLNDTTAPCPPSGVVYSGNGSFARVAWNASALATTYTVYDNSVTPKARLCSTEQLSCSLSNVASEDLVITATNTAGESETTPIMTRVSTQGRKRRDVSGQKPEHGGLWAPELNVTQATSTVVFIEWPPIDGASHYRLVIREQSGSREPQEITVLGESIILTELGPHSAYCFSASAQHSTTSGPESEPVCVQTGRALPQ